MHSTHVCSHVVICASSKDVCSGKARFHVCHILFPQCSTEQCFEILKNSLRSLGTHTCPQACWLSLRLRSLEAVSPLSYSVTLSNLMMPLSVPTSLLVLSQGCILCTSFCSFSPRWSSWEHFALRYVPSLQLFLALYENSMILSSFGFENMILWHVGSYSQRTLACQLVNETQIGLHISEEGTY